MKKSTLTTTKLLSSKHESINPATKEYSKQENFQKIDAAENELTKQIASKIRFLRSLTAISQVELAKILGISFQQVQKYEKGSTKITAAKLCMIASIFNVDLSFFFKDASTIKGIPESIQTDQRVMEDIKFISGYFENNNR